MKMRACVSNIVFQMLNGSFVISGTVNASPRTSHRVARLKH